MNYSPQEIINHGLSIGKSEEQMKSYVKLLDEFVQRSRKPELPLNLQQDKSIKWKGKTPEELKKIDLELVSYL